MCFIIIRRRNRNQIEYIGGLGVRSSIASMNSVQIAIEFIYVHCAYLFSIEFYVVVTHTHRRRHRRRSLEHPFNKFNWFVLYVWWLAVGPVS